MSALPVVFVKELVDALRDRRSVASAVAYAVLGPLMVALVLGALARIAGRDEPLEVQVLGRERAPALLAVLAEKTRIHDAAGDWQAAIRRGDVDLVLAVPEEFAAQLSSGRPATLGLYYDPSRRSAQRSLQRLHTVLDGYSRQVAGARLSARGVTPDLARPLDLEVHDVSTARARSAAALATLPLFLLLAAFVGGMNVAIDTCAGERERGSLEALLVVPVKPLTLAAGKWLAAAVIDVAVLLLTLGIGHLVLRSERLDDLELRFALSLGESQQVLLLLLPLCLLAPALQMALSIGARSFKEAQMYLSLLLFLPMVPGFLFAFETLEPRAWMHVVPVLGHQLGLESLIQGAPAERAAVLSVLTLQGITLLVTGLLLAVTARALRSERILRAS